MDEHELSKLSRRDLLELLLAEEKELQAVRKELAEANIALQNRKIQIEQSGTLAEACLQVNGFFDAAEKAARQFLENIRMQVEETNARCSELEEKTIRKCRWMEEETKRRANTYLSNIQNMATLNTVSDTQCKGVKNE